MVLRFQKIFITKQIQKCWVTNAIKATQPNRKPHKRSNRLYSCGYITDDDISAFWHNHTHQRQLINRCLLYCHKYGKVVFNKKIFQQENKMTKKQLKQKISECFANDKIIEKPAYIRELVDEFAPDGYLSEKDKAIECIKALSKIEGYTMSYEGMRRTGVLYDNIDLLMQYFDNLLKELDR